MRGFVSPSLRTALVAAALVAASACAGSDDATTKPFADSAEVDVELSFEPMSERDCTGTFAAVELDHTTTPRGPINAIIDGTGSGVTAEDIDGDGRIDLVLPNLSGMTNVLWNRPADDGGIEWVSEPVARGRFRQAAVVDLDHDGHRDLLFTTGIGPPQLYRGSPDGWLRQEVRDLRLITYSIAAGDLEGDGDVDFAAGSYNAELTMKRDLRVLNQIDVGSAVYRPIDDRELGFEEEVLSTSAQALVTLIVDIDGDGHEDVIAGNDLGTPDRIWLGGDRGLTFTELFDTTTLSTMSIDVADVDNDGDRDLIATDMAPLPGDPAAPWERLERDIEAARTDDVQQPVNVLQLAGDDGYDNVAEARGIAATGWSWAGLAGDLDNDGLLDLYVVNGMQGDGIFRDLPGNELVQANQAFRNHDSTFELMPEWGLDATVGGRGMTMADLDDDGDLDIVVNNLGHPATMYVNELCTGGAIGVELRWQGVQNVDALGASVVVDDGETRQQRFITGARGYLSSTPTRAHVGLGEHDDRVEVSVRWPDGQVSRFDAEPDTIVTVVRDSPPTDREASS